MAPFKLMNKIQPEVRKKQILIPWTAQYLSFKSQETHAQKLILWNNTTILKIKKESNKRWFSRYKVTKKDVKSSNVITTSDTQSKELNQNQNWIRHTLPLQPFPSSHFALYNAMLCMKDRFVCNEALEPLSS